MESSIVNEIYQEGIVEGQKKGIDTLKNTIVEILITRFDLPYSTGKKLEDGKITSFRAPALRINESTVKALEDTGFTTDSSVCSQRFDGPLTFGSKKKLNWMCATRKPYILSYESIIKKGNSKVLEIPISALLFPFIGTTMRVSPLLTKILQKYLYYESKNIDKPVVFLFHQNECLDIGEESN